MFFSLEALKAKKGDCLLVHFGTSDQPTLLVIDGGPSGVYRQSLQKRLKDLQLSRAPDGSLDIHLMLVSHIDDDHIKGILDLTRELRESRAEKKMPMCKVKTLWHNSFDDVVGNHVDTFIEETQSDLGAAAINGEFTPDLALDHPEAAMLVASVPQGRQLRDDAKLLEFVVNKPFDSIVEASGGANIDPPLATGLDVVVVGPTADRVEAFQEKWDKELKKRNLDQPDTISAADYLDKSVWNLASIVVLLRSGDKEILLTGDGRGDYILEGMEDAGLFENGKRHISILKVPHHGSSNNVEPDFFRAHNRGSLRHIRRRITWKSECRDAENDIRCAPG